MDSPSVEAYYSHTLPRCTSRLRSQNVQKLALTFLLDNFFEKEYILPGKLM